LLIIFVTLLARGGIMGTLAHLPSLMKRSEPKNGNIAAAVPPLAVGGHT
jgi:hypothetical protein